MNASPSPSATAAPPSLDMRRLVLFAAVLPAVIAGTDYAMMTWIVASRGSALVVYGLFAWCIAQVGLVGYVIGRGLPGAIVRWLVFGWIMVLINLLINGLMLQLLLGGEGDWLPEAAMPPAAFLAGQMGLSIVWGTLGDGRWTTRWAVMVTLVAGIAALWAGLDSMYYRSEMWTELLILQTAELLVICLLLRLLRFRLANLDGQRAAAPAGRDLSPTQFGVRDVLIWTTALAILLALAKSLDWSTWHLAVRVVRSGFVWKLSVATAAAMVIIVALWAALGKGHWLLRCATGLLFTLLIGSGLSTWSLHNHAALLSMMQSSPLGGIWPDSYYDLLRWYEIGWWWLGWLFLSGGLLAATLIILRTLGYRLVRNVGRVERLRSHRPDPP